jgi:hypothetical protein
MNRRTLVLVGALLAGRPAAAQSPTRFAPAPPNLFPTQPAPLPALPPASPVAPSAAMPAADSDPAEDLVSFDGIAARLEWVDQRWQVVAGGKVLKDFGRRESEARRALRLIQDLGLTQRGTVGRPAPVMEYWLASGRGPQGLTPGLRLLPLDLPSMRVEKIQAQWCLRDDQRILFNFGLHPEEARRALAILRKYRFTQVGTIGQAVPSMLLFLSEGEGMSGLSSAATSRIRKVSQRTPGSSPGQPADSMPGTVVRAALPPLQDGTSSLPHAHPAVFKGQMDRTALAGRKLGLPGWDEQGEWVPFDWQHVQVRQEEGVWKLAAGSYVVATFGADEEAARQALAAVRHYRFTEHCRVGRPAPVFSYFLVNGQAPRGLLFGLSGQAFQPDKLSVQALGRQWALCEGDRVLLVLDEDGDEARRLLEAIRRNGFDRLCRIGPSEKESMSFFVRVH